MLTIKTRAGRVAYEEQGAGAPLVLLSANPGDHHHFDDIVPVLARSFRTIALDWPGYGESPAPDPPRPCSWPRCWRLWWMACIWSRPSS